MKAAVLEEFKEPLVVKEVEDPEPRMGEVLIRTRAAGICRTDLKVLEGAIPTVQTPIIPGHEIAGEVVGLGPGVTGIDEGARVAVNLDLACGVCEYCRSEQTNYCANLRRLGFERDGGLAGLIRVPARNLVEIPPTVTFEEAATIPDAVGSPYHALINRADVRPGHTVAVYGLGSLGLMAVQVGVLAGAQVIGIARTAERRELAREFGAVNTVDPNDGDVSEQVMELTGGIGVHSFIDLVGIEGSVSQAVLSCRKGGRVVVLGYFVPDFVGSMMQLVYKEVAVMGSRGSTPAELRQAMSLVGSGRLRPVIGKKITLDQVEDEGVASLRDGSVIGRIVVVTDDEVAAG